MNLIRHSTLIAAAILLASCESPSTPSRAVLCNHCHTLWLDTMQGTSHVVLKPAKSITCHDCEDAATKFFEMDTFQQDCENCDGLLTRYVRQ